LPASQQAIELYQVPADFAALRRRRSVSEAIVKMNPFVRIPPEGGNLVSIGCAGIILDTAQVLCRSFSLPSPVHP
jgi:hypothetical protein